MIEFIKYPKINTLYKRYKKTIIPNLFVNDYIKLLAEEDVPIWRVSEKYDGFNTRICFDNLTDTLEFKGRNDNSELDQIEPYLIEHFDIDSIRQCFDIGEKDNYKLILFGESVGGNIQGNPEYSSEPMFRLFDVFVYNFNREQNPLVVGWWLNAENVVDVAVKLDIPTVFYSDELFSINDVISTVKTDPTSYDSEQPIRMEGFVLRAEKILDYRANPLMVKIKVNDFITYEQKLKQDKWVKGVANYITKNNFSLSYPAKLSMRISELV